jgi:hypothetical protein
MFPLTCKIIQRIANIEKKFTFWDILNLCISYSGMVILYRGNGNYTNNLTEAFDNTRAYIYGIICIIFWSLANYILHKNAIYVHHTIDTLYVALFNSILIPGLILVYFSFHPTSLSYNWEQFVYFGVSGGLTWVFHSQFTEVIKNDLFNSYLGIIYVYLFVCVVIDSLVYN